MSSMSLMWMIEQIQQDGYPLDLVTIRIVQFGLLTK